MDFSEIKIFKDKNDFSLERNDLICITNKDFINKNVIVLFYKKSEKKDDSVHTIFNKVGNTMKSINLNFISCAVDTVSGLEKAFSYITNDRDHPYHWIRNRPILGDKEGDAKYPFLLVYRKGFPQMFYEGTFNEKNFLDFCMNITVKLECSGNILSDKREIQKQQWIEYRKREKEEVKINPVLDAFRIDDFSLKK